MNRKAKRNFVIGRVMNRLRPDGPSAVIAERSRISSMTTEIVAAAPNSTGREKKIVKSCTGPSIRLADLHRDASRAREAGTDCDAGAAAAPGAGRHEPAGRCVSGTPG